MSPPVRQQGFSLIELIAALVVLGIAIGGVMLTSSGIFSGKAGNRGIQVGVKLLQSCAEQVLETRRAQGYPAALAFSCPDVAYTTPEGGAGTAKFSISYPTVTCPSGTTCTAIRIAFAVTTTGGAAAAPVNFLVFSQ